MASERFGVISVTDHDRLDANRQAADLAKKIGMGYLNGIEISSDCSNVFPWLGSKRSIHLLAYDFDLDSLEAFYSERNGRKQSLAKALHRELLRDGFDLSRAMIPDKLNRIDLAKALVSCGYAASIDESFRKILDHRYSGFYLNSISIEEVIRVVHGADGVVFWAHPFEILVESHKETISNDVVRSIVDTLYHLGVDGLEARYAAYDPSKIAFLEELASKRQMLISCGSDFHGKSDAEFNLLKSETLCLPESSEWIHSHQQ